MAESTGLSATPLHERAVHLDLVHGELLEVGEGGMAGTEVVDGQAHAQPVVAAIRPFFRRTRRARELTPAPNET
jgi:hypothetical protein